MPIVGKGPRLLTTSVQLEGKSAVPMISASRSINLLEQLPELRETLMFTSLLKDMITDTDEEPDEGCVGWGLGGSECRSFCLYGVGVCHPPGSGCTHQPEGSTWTAYYWGFTEASSPVYMLRCSAVSDSFAAPWTAAHQTPLSSGISQARILEGVAISYSRGSSQPRDQNLHLLHRQAGSLPLSHQGSPSSHRHDQFLSPFPAPLPSLKK